MRYKSNHVHIYEPKNDARLSQHGRWPTRGQTRGGTLNSSLHCKAVGERGLPNNTIGLGLTSHQHNNSCVVMASPKKQFYP